MPSDDSDSTAYNEFIESWLRQIKRLARFKLREGNCADPIEHAEDVVQEVCVKIREAWDRLRSPEAAFRTITVNTASDHARKCRREVPQEIDETATPSFTQHARTPEEIWAEAEPIQQLLGQLDQIDQAIFCFLYEGRTFAEMEVLLDKPSSTLRSRYRRALQQLRRDNPPFATGQDPLPATD